VPRLEQLEERTVLNVAPLIVVNPLATPTNAAVIEVGAYPLGTLAATNLGAAYTYNVATRSLSNNTANTSAFLFIGRITQSQVVWEGPQPIYQPGSSPPPPWVWDGPDPGSAPPKLAFDLHLDPAFTVLALPARPMTPAAPSPPRSESYMSQVDHPADSPVSTASSPAQSVALLGVRGIHSDISSVRFPWLATYAVESPILIREPRFEDQAVVITVGQVTAPAADAQTHQLRYDYAAASELSDSTSDVLPFRSTIATGSFTPSLGECIPAPTVSAPASPPEEILVESDVRALPAPSGHDESSTPAGRPDDQENRRDAAWPAWAAAGSLFVVLYRRAMKAWRRRRSATS
jgi:hypothetical protein